MNWVGIVDRFAALLGISCIILSIFTLYNIAVYKSGDLQFMALIILPLTILSAIWLKLAISIYSASYPPVKIGWILKMLSRSRVKD